MHLREFDTRDAVLFTPTDSQSDEPKDGSPYQLVVVDIEHSGLNWSTPVAPLTDVVGLDRCRNMSLYTPDTNQVSNAGIPYIDCDQDNETISRLLIGISMNRVACTVFFSSSGGSCALADHTKWIMGSIPNLFTIIDGEGSRSDDDSVDYFTVTSFVDDPHPLYRVSITGSSPKDNGESSKGSDRLISLYIALGVGLAILAILAIVGLCKLGRRPRNRRTGETRTRAIAQAVIDSIPLVKVQSSGAGASQGEKQSSPGRDEGDAESRCGINAIPTQETSGAIAHSANGESRQKKINVIPRAASPPAVRTPLQAPAPVRVNTYAMSGGVRTPQHAPRSANASENRSHVPAKTPDTSIDPPQYSTDGFPFPVMHENSAVTLETIEEHNANARSTIDAQQGHGAAAPRPHLKSRSTTRVASSAKTALQQDVALSKENREDKSIGVFVNRSNDSCSICLEEFVTGDILRALPCNHHFHAGCIDPWFLKEASTCPICRADLKTMIKHSKRKLHYSLRHSPNSRNGSRGLSSLHLGTNGNTETTSVVAPSLRRSHTMPVRSLRQFLTRSHRSTSTSRPAPVTNRTESNSNSHRWRLRQANLFAGFDMNLSGSDFGFGGGGFDTGGDGFDTGGGGFDAGGGGFDAGGGDDGFQC